MTILALILGVLLMVQVNPNSTGQNRLYSVPVQAIGTEREISPGDFQIARIAVDNPSQCWLYLTGINAYVPPQTLSRIASVKPTQSRIDVRFVNAPTGGIPSIAAGDPVQVTVYDTDSPDVAGTDYGLVPAVIDLTAEILALIAEVQQLRTAIDDLENGWGSNADVSVSTLATISTSGVAATAVPAPGAGYRLVIDAYIIIIGSIGTWSGQGIVLLEQLTPTKLIGVANINPNGGPTNSFTLPRSAGMLDENEALMAVATGGGGLTETVNILVYYHTVAV